MTRFLWKYFLRLSGWTTDIAYPFLHVKKHIIIIGPHTSNWDFIIGLAYRSLLHLQATRYLGKEELFAPPFGFIFRWLGGTPVNRKTHHNVVDQVSRHFDKHESFVLALSPEGTRKKVDKLRTGFYYIALKANVPIVMVGLDYAKKQILFSDLFYPSGDQEKDFEHILKFFRPIQGKVPEKGMGHL